MRMFWLIIGLAAVALGAVGIVLPLLPTVPFLLLAAFAFARSSDRLHNWLVSHKTFGPPIQDWASRGAINRKAKIYASISIALTFLISLALGAPDRVLIIQAVVLSAVTLFIWTRPE